MRTWWSACPFTGETMYERILTDEIATGKRTIFRADADGDNYSIETRMDVEPILNTAARIKSINDGHHRGVKFDPKKFMHHIATIPAFLFFDLKRKGVLSTDGTEILDEKKLTKFLNDNEWLRLRTHEGKV